MSWWTPATSKHMRQRRMDCLTGLQPWRGGTVVFNWLDPSKRKLSFFSSRRLKRQAYTGCIPPGLGLLSLLLWWLFSLVSTSSCWTVIACQLPSSRQPTFGSWKRSTPGHPLHRKRDYVNRPDVVYTQHRVHDRQGQGVLLVTEPHSELNAGLVVVFSSSHPSIFDWAEWTRRCRRLPDTEFDSLLAAASETVVQEFLRLLTGFLHRTLSSQDLTSQEMQQWVQSGLALSPLVATCTQYSVDFCLAWALIGEWTSRILFPVPKGPWPRHGHAGALLRQYQARSPRIVAWARATFEQGALPSLLFLQVSCLYLPCQEIRCFKPLD